MSDFHSNIKVFPSFPDTAFFSGEDFSCTLTFKNVAEPSPASSNTSLSQSRGTKIGADNNISKFTGVETMAAAGRSASEGGGVVSPERTTSPHSRSYSTVGHRGAERSNFNHLLRNHGRSQSVAELPALSDTTSPRISQSKRERKIERPRNGIPNLSIDISPEVGATTSFPTTIDTTSASPLAQISKLDLHSTVEDDASSETSSVGSSKVRKPLQTNTFNSYSPRPSLDLRESEPDPKLNTRRLPRSPLGRSSRTIESQAETLMIGYVQITGSFMIDEALINASEFDDIKSRGIVGGKSGGGVVGVDSRRGASWVGLGSLGGLSLGSLFGPTQPSSLADMRDRAGAKTIPILSTPPSILFIDVRLSPGESISFSYTFRLPKNLPPSHRGRALRTSYSLVITTQRPGLSQHLSTAEIPFRVFSNLDDFCQQPIYDLSSPIILLRDQAKIHIVKEDEISATSQKQLRPRSGRRPSTYSDKPIESSQEEFMEFVDNLLNSLGKSSMSASDPFARLSVPRSPSPTPTRDRMRRLSCREAIDFAIQRGVGRHAGTKSKIGIFEIGKDGVPVAKLTLPRTTYKLGEVVEGIVDFDDSPIMCYQIKSALESAEEIDSSISMRSQSSVYRATRRIHGSKIDFTAFAKRVSFAFEIPTVAAPSFQTSAVRHHWSLRLEFMTSLTPEPASGEESTPSVPSTSHKLLESAGKHERDEMFVATNVLYCDSFDCHVSIVVLATNQEIPEDRVGSVGFTI